ncbi:acyltransferase family protein, partial [Nostoc sp. NIES-2111]
FLLRRFLRIAPLYWLVTGLALAYFAAVNRTIEHGDVLASLLLLPAMEGNQRLPVIEVGWTLGFEALFYLVTYVVLVSRTLPALTVAGMACLAVLALRVLGEAGPFSGWLLNPIMMEFAAGLAIAAILSCRDIPWQRLGAACLTVGSALFLLTAWLGFAQVDEALSIVDGSLSVQRALLWGGPAGLIVAGALFLERAGRFHAGRVLVWIGNASFSLYLTHWLLFRVLRNPVAALDLPAHSIVLLGVAPAVP